MKTKLFKTRPSQVRKEDNRFLGKLGMTAAALPLLRRGLGGGLLALLFALAGCKEEDNGGSLISLIAPADNAVVEMDKGQDIRFEWNTISLAPKYRLAISKTKNLFDAETFDADLPPYLMPAADADAVAAKLGIPISGRDTLYWTVRSLPMMAVVETQVHALVLVRKSMPPVTLLAPADGATIDGNTATFPCTFTWQKENLIAEYTVLFSTDPAFPTANTVAVNRGDDDRYALTTADELDELLVALGVAPNGSETVYWAVKPTGGVLNSTPYTFTGVRKQKELLLPENKADVLLNYATPTGVALTFTWLNPTNAAAELLLSKNANMSSPITINVGAVNTRSYTHDELQALIENPANGLKRYYANTLYWNVRIGSQLVSATNGYFYLSGERVMIDVRGDETMVYEVAVIDNQYYKGIWMAQNLKTKKYLNGTDIDNSSDPVVFEAPPSTAFDYYGLPAYFGPVPPGDNPKTGYYYSWKSDKLITGNAPPFIPTGWSLPALADWAALFNAVGLAPAGMNVVLDPVVYVNSAYGAWGLNLANVGYFSGGEYPVSQFLFGDGMHYMKTRDDDTGICFNYLSPSSPYNYSAVAYWRQAPVRFKYTGDDE